jgi:O-acetyl-ADP-ribose deacetylase (regulator of RNase III)
MGLSTIAMPAISAGNFGFPKDRCAHIMTEEIAAKANGSTGLGAIDIYLMDPEIIGYFSEEIRIKDKVS